MLRALSNDNAKKYEAEKKTTKLSRKEKRGEEDPVRPARELMMEFCEMDFLSGEKFFHN